MGEVINRRLRTPAAKYRFRFSHLLLFLMSKQCLDFFLKGFFQPIAANWCCFNLWRVTRALCWDWTGATTQWEANWSTAASKFSAALQRRQPNNIIQKHLTRIKIHPKIGGIYLMTKLAELDLLSEKSFTLLNLHISVWLELEYAKFVREREKLNRRVERWKVGWCLVKVASYVNHSTPVLQVKPWKSIKKIRDGLLQKKR